MGPKTGSTPLGETAVSQVSVTPCYLGLHSVRVTHFLREPTLSWASGGLQFACVCVLALSEPATGFDVKSWGDFSQPIILLFSESSMFSGVRCGSKEEMLQALSGIRCCFPAEMSGKCQSPWSNRYWQMSPDFPHKATSFLLETCILSFILGTEVLSRVRPVLATCSRVSTHWQKNEKAFLRQNWDESPSAYILRTTTLLMVRPHLPGVNQEPHWRLRGFHLWMHRYQGNRCCHGDHYCVS